MDIYVPNKNLGISRSEMPQIKSTKVPDFIRCLSGQGIGISKGVVRADSLNATQREVNNTKVRDLAGNPANRKHLQKPVIISKDNYLMDGHHRWLALIMQDPDARISVVRVNMKIRDLLDAAKTYDGVSCKDIAASLLRVAREILG